MLTYTCCFYYLFSGYMSSLLLHAGFHYTRRVGAALWLWCEGLSLRWPLCCRTQALGCTGFSTCGVWAQLLQLEGSRAQVQWLWHTGLAAPQHVESFWTKDRTHVPCIGRQTLNHWSTKEVSLLIFKNCLDLYWLHATNILCDPFAK